MSRPNFKQWKKRAPKVPEQTCPYIDKTLDILEECKGIDHKAHKKIERRLEKLRTQNEMLRESGIYWYHLCKEHFKEIPYLNDIHKKFKKWFF